MARIIKKYPQGNQFLAVHEEKSMKMLKSLEFDPKLDDLSLNKVKQR